jgi:hypothetical protein
MIRRLLKHLLSGPVFKKEYIENAEYLVDNQGIRQADRADDLNDAVFLVESSGYRRPP